MRVWVWATLLLMALITQSCLIPLAFPLGARPDLLLVLVGASGLLVGKEAGVGIGFFAGLLQDLASGNIFGLHILTKMAIGYGAGAVEQKVFKESMLLPVIAMLVATVINSVLLHAVLFIFGYKLELAPSLFYNMVVIAIYNGLIAVPAHFLVNRLQRQVAQR